MANTKKIAPRPSWKTPDWSYYKTQRMLILWQVAALSLGADPEFENVKKASLDEAFKSAYEQRKKTLRRMLHIEQLEDHVTYFPDHPINKNKTGAQNRMVDVVSCIKKLQKTDKDHLPEEFTALLEPLSSIFLPTKKDEVGGLVLSPHITIVSSQKTEASVHDGLAESKGKKKDQSKAIETKESEQLAAMFYAVVLDAYAHDISSPRGLIDAARAVEAALEQCGMKGRYGFSDPNIKKALKLGAGVCKKEAH